MGVWVCGCGDRAVRVGFPVDRFASMEIRSEGLPCSQCQETEDADGYCCKECETVRHFSVSSKFENIYIHHFVTKAIRNGHSMRSRLRDAYTELARPVISGNGCRPLLGSCYLKHKH